MIVDTLVTLKIKDGKLVPICGLLFVLIVDVKEVQIVSSHDLSHIKDSIKN